MGWDVIIHSSAGVLALVLGGLMLAEWAPWATHAFSLLMVISFVSAVVISWWTTSWVRVHRALLPSPLSQRNPTMGECLIPLEAHLTSEWGLHRLNVPRVE